MFVLQLSASGDPGALDAVARRYRLENGNSLGEKDEVRISFLSVGKSKVLTLCFRVPLDKVLSNIIFMFLSSAFHCVFVAL